MLFHDVVIARRFGDYDANTYFPAATVNFITGALALYPHSVSDTDHEDVLCMHEPLFAVPQMRVPLCTVRATYVDELVAALARGTRFL